MNKTNIRDTIGIAITLLLVFHPGQVWGIEGKPLPPVQEPDWETWKDQSDSKIEPQMKTAWTDLSVLRQDFENFTEEELNKAKEKVKECYVMIHTHPQTACAVGTELIKNTADDWQRLMIASVISDLGGEKGNPFLYWAMATSKSVDATFSPAFTTACNLAEKRNPEFLPAMFLMLYAREGNIYFQSQSGYIPTQDSMFYVFGRYGRDVIPYLYHALKNDDPYVRRNASFVLGYFMDKKAVPALLSVLDANDIGSGGAAFALGQLGYVEAVPHIARLLKHDDSRTRFWGAYALYELGDKATLPALENALTIEKNDSTRKEIDMAIKHIHAINESPIPSVEKMTKQQLQDALEIALKSNGLEGDIEGIAATAGPDELNILEDIRLKTMKIASDMGHQWFRNWTEVIKIVRRRCD